MYGIQEILSFPPIKLSSILQRLCLGRLRFPPPLSFYLMAAVTNLSLASITKFTPFSYSTHVDSIPFFLKFARNNNNNNNMFTSTTPLKLETDRFAKIMTRAGESNTAAPAKKAGGEARVQKVHSVQEFDEALRTAKNKLVVVEYDTIHSQKNNNIYPFMVDLSRTCSDVEFILVIGDESEEMKELCKREKVEKVPHFTFYKGMEKIHEEEGIGPDQLMGDVLYYGDSHSGVVQVHSREDVEELMNAHKVDHKLVVLDVGLKHCGPCVKVYPTVLKLSRQMETVVFARMNGDENDSTMKFLRDMDVVEVPTFLFIRDGKICGRYVGSGKGELIGEILRYQGVRVTY